MTGSMRQGALLFVAQMPRGGWRRYAHRLEVEVMQLRHEVWELRAEAAAVKRAKSQVEWRTGAGLVPQRKVGGRG